MRQGFVKAAAVTPKIKVADTKYNAELILDMMKESTRQGAKIVVFPELCLTGYTCQDLFLQERLLQGAKDALMKLVKESASLDAIFFVGLPFEILGKLYNVAAVFSHGEVLGLVPKSYLPNYNEFYEARYFTSGEDVDGTVTIRRSEYGLHHDEEMTDEDVEFGLGAELEALEEEDSFEELEEIDEEPDYIDEDETEEFDEVDVPISSNILFICQEMPKLKIAAEICEDLWVPNPPSVGHAYHGANLIVNLSASDEVVGKDSYRKSLVSAQSARLLCGYIYATAGEGESTQDVVYGGHNLIAENGTILAESRRFVNGALYADLDIHRLDNERRRMTTCRFVPDLAPEGQDVFYNEVYFNAGRGVTPLTRKFDSRPFVPGIKEERERRCDEILNIQAMGLKKRLAHIHCQNAVIGLSGGLDSTLALLVTVRAFDMLGMPREKITAVTMPCFGTTDRTYNNACQLSECLGATLKEVNIREAVNLHFRDIGHDPEVHDVTYENGQARERTQILMDIANQSGGIVIGTGDLSELALGWATYNGDHMSMYAVNASVPKTLVRHLVRYYADTCEDAKLSEILLDILDTPVSPELLPPKDGVISQKTEDLVGPYELHDFFLYYMLRWTFPPKKIFRLAQNAFAGEYDDETILKWLKTFYRRFFMQQFKRSCLPDGPKVGSVAVSPRGDLRMPSDACAKLWLKQIEELEARN